MIADFYIDEEDQAQCLEEWQAYHSKKTLAWKERLQWLQAKRMPGHEWWSLNGGHSPLLRPLAIKLLTLGHAAGGSERNWSSHDFLSGKRRTRSSTSTLEKEVYCYTNQRLLDRRRARGKFKKVKKTHYDERGNEVAYPAFCNDWSSEGE